MKVIAVTSKNGGMFKIGEGEQDAVWYFLSEKVAKYAMDNIKKGDEVSIKSFTKSGKKTITYITNGTTDVEESKVDKPSAEFVCEDCGYELKDGKYKKCYKCNQKKPAAKEDPTKFVCTDCGQEMKDGKYKKCYTCNQKNPAPKSGSGYGKSPEVQASIKRQAIGHMTSRTMIALQGHIDPNNIQEQIRAIYALYVELVG